MRSNNKNGEVAPKDNELEPHSGSIQLKHQVEDEIEIVEEEDKNEDEDEDQNKQGGDEESEDDVGCWQEHAHSSSAGVVGPPSGLAQIAPNTGSPNPMYESPWDLFTGISHDALHAALQAGPDFDLPGISLGDSDFDICTSLPTLEGISDPQQAEMMGESHVLSSVHLPRAELPISTNQEHQRVEGAHYTARSGSDASKVVLTIEEPDTRTVDSLLQVAVASNLRFHFARQ